MSIEELIDLCRAKGVIHAKLGDMEITLGAGLALEDDTPKTAPAGKLKLGADGLTQAEQEILYGTPFPDTHEG